MKVKENSHYENYTILFLKIAGYCCAAIDKCFQKQSKLKMEKYLINIICINVGTITSNANINIFEIKKLFQSEILHLFSNLSFQKQSNNENILLRLDIFKK